MASVENTATGERIAFLTFSKQLAQANDGDDNQQGWRSATLATNDGLMNGKFAGFSEDGRFLRVAELETPLGKVDKCSLRDTDVLFARFHMSEAELEAIGSARLG
jgi:hypothetical protein